MPIQMFGCRPRSGDVVRKQVTDEIDCELIILGERRVQALDLLIRSWIELATIDNRVNVLLDRRQAATSAPMIYR